MHFERLKYSYDKMGNISAIFKNGTLIVKYTYDTLNRIIREDNRTLKKTWMLAYDNNGNIITKKETEFMLKENTEDCVFTEHLYEYDGDELVYYDGKTCCYMAKTGKPSIYKNNNVYWSGVNVAEYGDNTFTYDACGRRLTKNNLVYTYDSNGKLIRQSNGLEFFYDHTGVAGMKYNGTTYIYRKDVQGNIIALLDSNGAVVVKYAYDAWGNVSVMDNNGTLLSDVNHIGNLNPFRYRGYYYDAETKLYFLKTRYYDPEVGRFITIDDISYIDPETINGLNLYAYCNNPVSNVDPNGNKWWHWLIGAIIIIGLGVATALTGGAAGVILGSAFYGAITGAVSSAVIGGVIGGISSVVSGDGFFSGFIEGASTGFMSGALIGGAIGALTAGINIATGAVKIVGSAQKTGTFFHRFASNVSAGKMAMQVGRYSQITLDRSLNKAGMVGRKMPDVMGKARWDRDLIVEVTSKSQTHAQMASKLKLISIDNPTARTKIIDLAAWIGRHLF